MVSGKVADGERHKEGTVLSDGGSRHPLQW